MLKLPHKSIHFPPQSMPSSSGFCIPSLHVPSVIGIGLENISF